jgi:hypothetical protein
MYYDFQTTVPSNEWGVDTAHDDYEDLACAEAERLEALIIQKFGRPPLYCFFDTIYHSHDIGTYITLGLSMEDEADEDRLERYYERIMEDFPEYWEGAF